MTTLTQHLRAQFHEQFKVFHELMAKKIREILLVASPYDAFVIEEDESLASRIIHEYSGLNLSQPPRITRTASARSALALLENRKFDMVIAMPHLEEMDAFTLGAKIKEKFPELPVHLLAHSTREIEIPEKVPAHGVDRRFVWTGNSDLLLALVKSAEDRLNVDNDTRSARVRVLILVEDTPFYYSMFLPFLYRQIVRQTQSVLGVGLNEEHRLLRMRSRPKILHAENYEDAVVLYRQYQPYLLGVISDTRIPREGILCPAAGAMFLSEIRKEMDSLPLLLLSSESENRALAEKIPAGFAEKNSSRLLARIHEFFLTDLGFGDFVFRMPDGREINRAKDLRSLQEKIAEIPKESLWYHAKRNHFSNWIMGRSEITLALQFREVNARDFPNTQDLRNYIIDNIKAMRKWQQKGIVAQYRKEHFDPDVMDFLKIGHGSLGGKARGLAFMSAMLTQTPEIYEKYPDIHIRIPKTLVISTNGFESFMEENDLQPYTQAACPDAEIQKAFLNAKIPRWLVQDLRAFLLQVKYPLSIRSSSLLEDAHFQPYAGLYETYMIPNNHASLDRRLDHLEKAIKLVFASTYFQGPKSFAKSTTAKNQEESMAVIVQQLVGKPYDDLFYPMISGVAQSHNFYPVAPMKSEEGIVHIAFGLGRTVVEGEKTIRFCPRYPEMMPQFSAVDDILSNAQQYFYALRIRDYPEELCFHRDCNLERRSLSEMEDAEPVRMLSSSYNLAEHRIRDSGFEPGPRVMTFASVLKYGLFPLAEVICDLLELGRKGMGVPVEIEFSVDITAGQRGKKGHRGRGALHFLQVRPMTGETGMVGKKISGEDIRRSRCFSRQALGMGEKGRIRDVVYVKQEAFLRNATQEMAEEIGKINARLALEGKPYLLVGPGRWGSADRWLGIPVKWHDISGVGGIIELRNEKISADPSQGTHFFQNITALGIPYITVTEGSEDFLDWQWMEKLPSVSEGRFIRHAVLEKPIQIKIDSLRSQAVILDGEEDRKTG